MELNVNKTSKEDISASFKMFTITFCWIFIDSALNSTSAEELLTLTTRIPVGRSG